MGRAIRAWRARSRFTPSFRYLLATEVHVYAFSIAANALLSFFPFVLILLGICRNWLHWQAAYNAIFELLRANLPSGANFVIQDLTVLVTGRQRIQVISVLLMFYASSGVFLPLEVALNKVWCFHRNRSLLTNVLISFCLAIFSGLVALLSAAAAGGVLHAVSFLFGWLPWHIVVTVFSRIALEILSVPLTIVIYFAIYYWLPHGKVAARQVLPAAIVAGIATEIIKVIYFLTLPLLNFRETYGPFAVPVTLLFWAYVGSMVMLWGAHFSAQGPFPPPA
ncbi:MAG: YihY/virulence factor BrkB family protein [Terriglobia bacterium]